MAQCSYLVVFLWRSALSVVCLVLLVPHRPLAADRRRYSSGSRAQAKRCSRRPKYHDHGRTGRQGRQPRAPCPGTSAAGALELATSGSWSGTWFSGLGYSVETIAGESHPFEAGAPANFFWSFWLDNKPASTGICEAELNPGDSVLFFPECFSETGACPPAPNPLGIVAPPVAERRLADQPVAVTSYANASGAASPAVGATVTGGGASATTDSAGKATLTFSAPGTVVASGERSGVRCARRPASASTPATTAPAAPAGPVRFRRRPGRRRAGLLGRLLQRSLRGRGESRRADRTTTTTRAVARPGCSPARCWRTPPSPP